MMKISTFFFGLLLLCGGLAAQGTIEWVHLDAGTNNGSCSSTTDCANNLICYGVQYTPPITAEMTSYTLSYSGSCDGNGTGISTNTSCVLADNSQLNDACDASGLFQLFTSASGGGTVALTANTPIILHQVCIDLSVIGSLQINVDQFSPEPYTVSLNLPGSGFDTDTPTFVGFLADDSGCSNTVTCDDAPLCSLNFGTTSGRVSFPININGLINDGTAVEEADQIIHAFDVYNELDEDCTQGGGVADITVASRLINTYDAGGNGIIDPLGGQLHQISQGADGLVGRIPLGADANSESSPGDIRGYEITVEFADHIGVRADQITVDLSGLNSPGEAFESASLVFLNNARVPYASPTYIGYFNGANDLSGDCLPTAATSPYTAAAAGGLVFATPTVVDLTDPCDPVSGSGGSPGSLNIAAVADAGLDPMDVVRGFTLRVYAEDLAAAASRDDGSGLDGDDGVVANANSTTNMELISSLLGYSITDCVFEAIALPVSWLDFTARKEAKNVKLDWATAEEINHSHFTVEWSKDGRIFETIGRVEAASNADLSGAKFYDLLHQQPVAGLNYYRIRQHDVDGATSLSVLRTVNFNDAGKASISLFPNPVGAQLTLVLASPATSVVQGEIYTTTGRLVQSFPIEADMSVISINTAQLPRAMYLLRVGEQTQRFIKR